MTRNRLFALVALVVVGVVVLGASAHAAAGAGRDAAECVACSLCEWLHSVLS